MRARMLGLPEWQLDAAEAVPTGVIDDLVADSRRSWFVSAPPAEPVRGTGWSEPAPLKPPDGINYIDAMCEAQDRQDKLDRLQAEMERRKTVAALTPPEMPKADQETPRAPSKK
jgi:hypothetical protein